MARVEAQWKCDNCGRVGPWTDTWASFGSIALEEERPRDMIHTCSDHCREVVSAKLDSGDIEQPVATCRGLHTAIKGKRRGY